MLHSGPVVNCGRPMSVIRTCFRLRSILPLCGTTPMQLGQRYVQIVPLLVTRAEVSSDRLSATTLYERTHSGLSVNPLYIQTIHTK